MRFVLRHQSRSMTRRSNSPSPSPRMRKYRNAERKPSKASTFFNTSPRTENTAVNITRLPIRIEGMDFAFGTSLPNRSRTMFCTASGYERRPARFFLSVPVHRKQTPQYRNQNAGIINHFIVISSPSIFLLYFSFGGRCPLLSGGTPLDVLLRKGTLF